MRKFVRIFAVLLLCLFCAGCGRNSTTEISLEKPEPTAAEPVSISGSYHGSWEIFNCSERWAELETLEWECWAEISEDSLYIWDEDFSKEEGLADLSFTDTDGELKITGGSFMEMNSGFENWRLSLENDGEQKLVLRGRYEGKVPGGFSFVMYLQKENTDG